jgi:uncharacterized protein YyaL (SSP411 family)
MGIIDVRSKLGWRAGARSRWATVLAVATSASVMFSPAAQAGTSGGPQALAKAGMAELMLSYSGSSGLIGNSSWWQSALALGTLEDYEQATGDTEFDYAIAGAYQNKNSCVSPSGCGSGYIGDFRNAYMDDTGWWGLAWLGAYHVTGNSTYLATAEDDASYINSHRDATCGGVWWNTSEQQNEAIANGVFLDLAARLYDTTGNSTYLSWAEYEWSSYFGVDFGQQGAIVDGSYVVTDGLDESTCKNDGGTGYTYNQGVVMAGLARLYSATGNAGYAYAAEDIANSTTASEAGATCTPGSGGVVSTTARYTTGSGVLCDPGEAPYPTDTGTESFKGVFVQGLKTLADDTGLTGYNPFFAKQACAIKDDDTTSSNQFGVHWAGPITALTSYSQASAEEALVTALGIPLSEGGCS